MRNFLTALVLLVGSFLAGCSTLPQGKGDFKAVAPKTGLGVIYVGRPHGWNVSYVPLEVELNGKRLAYLGVNSYTRVEVPPGRYSVSPHDGYWTKVTFGIPHPVEIKVQAGHAYYLLPKKWTENERNAIEVIGTTVVPTKTADSHGTFSVEEKSIGAQPPQLFQQLDLTPSEQAATY